MHSLGKSCQLVYTHTHVEYIFSIYSIKKILLKKNYFQIKYDEKKNEAVKDWAEKINKCKQIASLNRLQCLDC